MSSVSPMPFKTQDPALQRHHCGLLVFIRLHLATTAMTSLGAFQLRVCDLSRLLMMPRKGGLSDVVAQLHLASASTTAGMWPKSKD